MKIVPTETIRFVIDHFSLGTILIAASDQGVCAILLGDDPAELANDLTRRFKSAAIAPAQETLLVDLTRVIEVMESPTSIILDLPLDLRGTDFQKMVWAELCRVPPGVTASYAEIANRIGRPKAVRAVAAACAANPLALAVPCHRVRRADGSLSGYRWGIERKQSLLDREAAAITPPAQSR
jgi:AraC family transcriptional regulator, regulatory protein of adaptative response / methylated-DNA-[protein]-cysteine methyltransferase